MGRRGPPPKPTKLKELAGNPGRRKLPTDEPKPRIADECPPPPDHLPEFGKLAWKFLSKELHAIGLLTTVDEHALEQYCTAYAYWRRCLAEVEAAAVLVDEFKDDGGNVKYTAPNPHVSLMLKFGKELNSWSKVLGLGPAYRVALSVGKGDEPIDDPLGAKLEKG